MKSQKYYLLEQHTEKRVWWFIMERSTEAFVTKFLSKERADKWLEKHN